MTELLYKIPEELDNIFDKNICAPTFAELNELAMVDDIELRVVTVKENGIIQACLPCFVESRRHHGITIRLYSSYSGALHDYQRFYCISKSAAKELRQAIIKDARQCSCDLISIDSLIPHKFIPDRFCKHEEIKIFDSTKEKKGWKELYVRKSVKRFEHDARRSGDYHVDVIDGRVNDELMKELKDLHILRWNFAGSSSAFENNDKRIEQYLCNPENKHYLRVMLGDEILACHYGMRYGSTLLWHTPLINPKYLRLSPLRLLLAEEAKYCEANGFELIDFGLGDEAYKNGCCHDVRQTLTFEYALNLKGYFTKMSGSISTPFVKNQINSLLNIARTLRNKIDTSREHWLYFVAPSEPKSYSDPLFVDARSWHEMYDLAKQHNYQVLDWQYQRFKDDDSCVFVALADDTNILTYGWISETNRSLIERKDLTQRILYDFVTPEEFRRQGLYTRLLKHLISNGGGLIYADIKNIPSLKAIRKAGFIQV